MERDKDEIIAAWLAELIAPLSKQDGGTKWEIGIRICSDSYLVG
jgi:hypothetical protein